MPVTDSEYPNWLWRADSPASALRAETVVFDMDGVISDASHRQHFLNDGRRDWDGFFGACGDDAVIEDTAVLLDLLGSDHSVVLLTARPMRVRPETLDWLDRHDLRWDGLFMRDYGDYTASRRFKSETVDQMKGRGMDLRLAFEDDIRNVEMFRAHEIPCIYIHSGYYE